MADIQTEEGWHTLEDGHKLYTKTWKVNIRVLPNKAQKTNTHFAQTADTPKARLVFIHGFSDHCTSSFHLHNS
jgi:acylglycerol lipase